MESKAQFLVNTFTGGMMKDLPEDRMQSDTYLEAWNAVIQNDANFVFTNEHGNVLAQEFGGEVVGYMRVPDRNWTLFFTKNQSSHIWIFNHDDKTKELVVSDSEYGCNWNFDECELILGEYKTMQPCSELVIYFSSNCTYYTVNVDEVRDAKRKGALTCEDFLLMRCVCSPTMLGVVVENIGDDLPAGAYQFATRLIDKDGNESNWFLIGEPVYLGSEDNIAGQVSRHGINLFLNDLDPRYTRVDVAVVRTIGGATTAHLISTRSYSTDGVTVVYTSTNQHLEDISLQELLIKRKTYLMGRRLFQKDGRLFLYQLQQEKNLNYQRQANNIGIKYVVNKVPSKEAWRFKGLMRDEVYALGIVWKYCDGTYSPVYHIPNNVDKPDGNADSCVDCDIPIWLKESTAVREEVYCDEVQNPLEEYCYCPPNAECDEDCNVIIGDDIPDDGPNPKKTEICFIVVVEFPNPQECSGALIEFRVIVDGVEQTFLINANPSQTFYPISFEAFSFNVAPNPIEIVGTTGNCPPGTLPVINYYKTDCGNIPGAQEEGLMMGLTSGKSGCGPGGCGSGSFSCPGGSCGSGGTCFGSGCGFTGGNSIGGGFTGFSSDIRNDAVHQLAYQKAQCQNATEFLTDNGDLISCAECAADPLAVDGPKIFKSYRLFLEHMKDLMRRDDEVVSSPSLNTTSTLSEAVGGVCSAIEGLDTRQRKKAELEFKGDDPKEGLIFASPSRTSCFPEPIYGPDGCTIVGYKPALVAKGRMGYWESCETYPLDLDCDGLPIYGNLAGKPIRHHKTPDATTEPIMISNSRGVRNYMQLENDPEDDTFAYVLGIEASNIVYPTNPPKPICGYEIVMAKRGVNDRSVIAKGMTSHTFRGNVYGRDYAFMKHGVNSFETVDRYIENGEDENHLGQPWEDQIFAFHSPDLNTFDLPLNADTFHVDYEIYGTGWRHGLYAIGSNSNNIQDPRLDRRGARSEISLNKWDIRKADACIRALTYAPADSIVKKGDRFSYGINHRFREKVVYFELNGSLPRFRRLEGMRDGYSDYSFIGDGVDHSQPVNLAISHYGAMKRINKCQYGGIESLTYTLTGIRGTSSTITGTIGDTYITMYSFKKSSYVSNKVGDILNEQFEDIAGGRIRRNDHLGRTPRTICFPRNLRGENMLEYIGMYDHTELPTTGDTTDPKNMSSLHPTRRWNEVYNSRIDAPESDVYYPRVQTTLIHFWCESEINQKFRQSGSEELREIFYGNLKGNETDSSLISGGVAEEGWLNDFHQVQKRISRNQLAARTALRTFVTIALPAIFGAMVASSETGLEIASTLATAPLLYAIWLILDRFVLSVKNINRLLNIPECKTDAAGAEQDEDIKGFKDNYHRYNLDYSKLNDINQLLPVPPFYNTCDCSDCENWNNEIYYSNRQNIDSGIDAYRNFQANDYLNIPAHAGRLMNLFSMDNRFYAHTTDGIWVLQYANVGLSTDQGLLILGGGDLLSDPQQIMEGILEGHAGIQHPKSAINTRMGYMFVDEESRKLYIFNSQGLKEINGADSGMYNYLRENLLTCVESCKENPYKIGVDYENNRILFSNGNQTLSYSLLNNKWISFHTYFPELFIFDRYNFYSVKNGNIWQHGEGSYATFYGEAYPTTLEFPINNASKAPGFGFDVESLLFDIETNGENVRNIPKIFDQIWLHNTHQSTNTLDARPEFVSNVVDMRREMNEVPGTIRVYREDLNWNLNNIRDAVVDPLSPFINYDVCANDKTPIQSNHDCSRSWDKAHRFFDKYLNVKLFFRTFANNEVNIKSVFTRAKDTNTKLNG